MKKYLVISALLVVLLLVAAQCGVVVPPVADVSLGSQALVADLGSVDNVQTAAVPEYAGRESCKECHEERYNEFMQSGHPYKLNKVVDGQPPEYPFSEVPNPPEGYTWDDITYVIGGYGWKARFIDKDGFIITGADENATTQYNLYNEDIDMGDNWVGYHAGEKEVPYNCGTCHTTGYNPEGHQDGLPGLIGTWSEPGIQCEACHGPGSLHNENPYNVSMKVDRDADMCGTCHRRGDISQIDASGGFTKHHEQFEEMRASKHAALNCIDCHDPHKSTKYGKGPDSSINNSCENCHFEKANYQKITDRKHAECVDCHMARSTKSALGDPDRYTGDIRGHLFSINPLAESQFTEDGKFTNPYVGLDFACKGCHYDGGPASVQTDEALVDLAVGYHDKDMAGSANK
ncbi:MAG: hypothetical protein D6768_14550 [Chloroflexi bacterium]|nr:MAG: hypothetical protein D6768_14550 [Chloroflexota bacterium]